MYMRTHVTFRLKLSNQYRNKQATCLIALLHLGFGVMQISRLYQLTLQPHVLVAAANVLYIINIEYRSHIWYIYTSCFLSNLFLHVFFSTYRLEFFGHAQHFWSNYFIHLYVWVGWVPSDSRLLRFHPNRRKNRLVCARRQARERR